MNWTPRRACGTGPAGRLLPRRRGEWSHGHASGNQQDTRRLARRTRHLRIAEHERLRDSALAKYHELSCESFRIVDAQADQKIAEQAAPPLFVGDGNPMGRMRRVSQFGNSIHERTAAIPVTFHRAFEPIEV